MREKKHLSLPELVVQTAFFLKGTPYVGATLEKNEDNEKLVINLRELDCTTLVENCIALSQTLKTDNVSFLNYCALLQQLRYRNGVISDYASRLHYSSDWASENEKRGVFKNIGKDLGGVLVNRKIDFMSAHPEHYSQLRKSNKILEKIKIIEDQLNKTGGYYVIEKEKLANVDNEIKNGDIILFSTLINGLDFTHMGIAYRSNNRLSFIHASSSAQKVVIEQKSLYQYCQNSKKCDGIVILRLNVK